MDKQRTVRVIGQEHSVSRVIRAYSRTTEALILELPLTSFDLESVRQIFDIPGQQNPMFDCYEISPALSLQIEPCMGPKPDWDFSSYRYYLEADADE